MTVSWLQEFTHPHFKHLEPKWPGSSPGSKKGRSDWFNSKAVSSTIQPPLAKGCDVEGGLWTLRTCLPRASL